MFRKTIGLVSALVLAVSFTPAAQSQELETVQRTLAPYSGSTTSLSAAQKQQIRDVILANPNAEKFICTGIRFATDPTSVNITVRARAKQACEYAKQLNPALSTWFQNKPTSARSYAGKVLLTVKTATTAMTFENYSPAKVSQTAFNSVAAVAAKQQPNPKNFQIVAGPNVTAAQLKLETQRLSNSLRFWSQSYDKPFTAYLYSGKDADWMVTELAKLGNTEWAGLVKNGYWQQTGECSQSATDISSANRYIILCQTKDSSQVWLSHIFAHEYAHLPLMDNAQNQALGDLATLPVWLNEGGAQYLSIALTNQAKDSSMRYWHDYHLHGSSQTVKLSTRSKPLTLAELLPTITVAETEELMTLLEDQSVLTSTVPYSVGNWATEVLVSVKGAQTYLKFLDTMSPTKDWRAAFEEVYEIRIGEFYRSLTPYLNWIGKNFPA